MDNESLKKVVVQGLTYRFGERIFSQLVSTIVAIILARVLIPEDFGIVSLVTIFITLFNAFVSAGLGNALIQKKDSNDDDFSTMLWAGVIISVVLYAIVYFIAPLIAEYCSEPLVTSVLRTMGLVIPLSAINTIQHAYISKRFLFRLFFISTLGGIILSGAIGITMACYGYGVWSLVTQYLSNSFISTIVLGITMKWMPKFCFSYKQFRKMFSFAWKKNLSLLVNELYEEYRGLIIAKIYSIAELSYYSKGKQIPHLIGNNISMTLANVMFPVFATIQDDKIKLREMVRRSMRICNYALFAIMVCFAVVADKFVTVILTDKWLFAIPYMRIFCLVYIFNPIKNINKSAINAVGRSDLDLYANIVEKAIGLIAVLIAMNMGAIYLAWSALITYISGALIYAYINGVLLQYKIKEQLNDVVFALTLSVIMAAAMYSVGYLPIASKLGMLLIQMLVGAVVYVCLSALLKIDSLIYLKNIVQSIYEKKINNVNDEM